MGIVSVVQLNKYTRQMYNTLKAGELHGICIILDKMFKKLKGWKKNKRNCQLFQ